jgi:hypothetical protein
LEISSLSQVPPRLKQGRAETPTNPYDKAHLNSFDPYRWGASILRPWISKKITE